MLAGAGSTRGRGDSRCSAGLMGERGDNVPDVPTQDQIVPVDPVAGGEL